MSKLGKDKSLITRKEARMPAAAGSNGSVVTMMTMRMMARCSKEKRTIHAERVAQCWLEVLVCLDDMTEICLWTMPIGKERVAASLGTISILQWQPASIELPENVTLMMRDDDSWGEPPRSSPSS